MKKIIIIILLCNLNYYAQSVLEFQDTQKSELILGNLLAETNVDSTSRNRSYFSSNWKFKFDDNNLGEQEQWFAQTNFSDWQNIKVPSTWNLHIPNSENRQTVGWYAFSFTPEFKNYDFYKLKFEGIFREAKVWLNGVELGKTDIPYLPFSFDVSKIIKKQSKNTLVVRVDNRLVFFTLPCDTKFNKGKHGWFPYGGIIRQVYLESGKSTYVAQCLISTENNGEVSAKIRINDNLKTSKYIGGKIQIKHNGIVLKQTSFSSIENNQWLLFFDKIKDPILWMQDKTNGYKLIITLNFKDGTTDDYHYYFGFNDFTVEDRKFYLNKEQIFLKGINRHEDSKENGVVFSQEIINKDVGLITELNANFIRPGHYPNDIRNLKELEKIKILVCEEIPVYQLNKEQLGSDELIELSEKSLKAMIIRDFNNPSIVMWSVANEIHYWRKNAVSFLQKMKSIVEKLNPQREVFTARLSLPNPLDKIFKDKSSRVVDVLGLNIYAGWYYGDFKTAEKIIENANKHNKKIPIILSEFGAGTLLNKNSDTTIKESNKNHTYSETYQLKFYKNYLNIISKTQYIQGMMPWVMSDFRMQWSPKTGKPHPVENTNLKGLTTLDRKKKKSFYLIKDYYAK